ncbi:MAG TPA: hypothetical protein VFJ93_02535 [Gaiellaceae bacterium]|nr:hypothetical protein [Gaiellaceae bacterium]
MNGARRLLLLAQLAFWSCVLLCFLVTGGGLGHNHGFSVYGGKWTTILPWAVGIAAAAGLIWRAADALADEDPPLARCLRANVVLLVFILLTPDSIDRFFYVAHIVASVALFLFQAIVGLWLVLRTRSSIVLQLYVLQIGAGLVAGASQAQWIGLLSPGILVFQLAFGALIVSPAVRQDGRSSRAHAASSPR